MKYYHLALTIIILMSFASQILHNTGMWIGMLQNESREIIVYCKNKDFQNKSKIDLNTSHTVDINCTTNISFFFVSKPFSLEPIITKQNRETIVSYQNIKEQLYVDELIDPPQV